ncbi:Patched domain containing protein [Phytophthora palmivora]|uniref:Patched domain containing protein n=1 Tax=Phytophthora palmivora TaxID=4796 RepID=A0A2P4Y3U1_9STRA|nr:Patched domain containing protein [Phytophthora palmivora]
MNVWAFDDEPVASRPRVKKACFADEVEVTSTTGWGDDTQSQRRKQRRKVEFLVEDHQASDDDADVKKVDLGKRSVKTNEISSVEAVEHVTEPVQMLSVKQERSTRKDKKKQEVPERVSHDITVHHLVREFLLMHCHEDVAKILDQERPMPVLDATEIKQLNRRLTRTDTSGEYSSVPSSLLERFLVCSNEAKLKARTKRATKEKRRYVILTRTL